MTEEKKKCQGCGKLIATIDTKAEMHKVSCPLCGHYKITDEQLLRYPGPGLAKHIVSGFLRNYWEMYGKEFLFQGELFESAPGSPPPQLPIPIPNAIDIPTKADLILHHIRRKTKSPGDDIEIIRGNDYPVAFCASSSELVFCLNYLLKQELVTETQPISFGFDSVYCITPKGWAYLSGIGAASKEQGFIAMAFRIPTSDDLFKKGLIPGIGDAGFKPLRIDSKEHNNRIDDEIVAEIRKSKFVVADLTGKNAGAYFEAGFAMGLGKPVIWTCAQADIDAPGGVHFDTRQYSIVPWEPDKLEDFAKRLALRIEATMGHGKYVPDTAVK